VSPSEPTAPVEPIAEGGVLLHIGPPKTGSTGIQNAMHSRRDALAEHGVHYAGKGYRPREAGWAVLGIGAPMGRPTPRIGRWNALVQEIHAHQGDRVCLSSEDFARATPEAIERILDGVGVERVHLLHVVRRMDRLLPSLWQERVKARLTRTYDDWLRAVLAEESDEFEWRNLWGAHDVTGILDRWGAHLPRERITFICSDDSDRALIPETFESLLGLPSGMLTPDPTRSNRSLTGNEVELLRRVNEAARREGWAKGEYLRIGQMGITRGFKQSTPAPTDEKIPPLPIWAHKRIVEFSQRQAEVVRSSGATVVGDPDVLLTHQPGDQPESREVTTVDIDTAVTAVLGAVHGARRQAAWELERATVAPRQKKKRPQRIVAEVSSRELLRVIAGRARRRLRRR